jgi:zinc transport system substrate-binding protein
MILSYVRIILMKKTFAAVLVLTLVGCSNSTQTAELPLPQITTGAFPVAWLASELAGGCAGVTDLTPSGGDVHDLELTASQTRAILSADLVLTVSGFQPSFDDAVTTRTGTTLDLINEINPITGVKHGHEDDEHGHEDDDEHGHEDEGGDKKDNEILDPHFWLDPSRSLTAVELISDQIAALDENCATAVASNKQRVISDLTQLDLAYSSELAQCQSRTLIVSHQAFGYLADAYNLTQIAVAGLDPEGEPSAARLKEVINLAKAQEVSAVFTESNANPAVAETLAKELAVGILTLDPIELKPASLDYLLVMNTNLENLKQGLACR